MGTNKATGKLGKMINIICRPFLSPLLTSSAALLTIGKLIFLLTLKFHFILFSFKFSHLSLLCSLFFFPTPNLLQIAVLFSLPHFLQEVFAGEKARTFPLPPVISLTIFLLLMSNNFPAPGNTNSFPFL